MLYMFQLVIKSVRLLEAKTNKQRVCPMSKNKNKAMMSSKMLDTVKTLIESMSVALDTLSKLYTIFIREICLQVPHLQRGVCVGCRLKIANSVACVH